MCIRDSSTTTFKTQRPRQNAPQKTPKGPPGAQPQPEHTGKHRGFRSVGKNTPRARPRRREKKTSRRFPPFLAQHMKPPLDLTKTGFFFFSPFRSGYESLSETHALRALSTNTLPAGVSSLLALTGGKLCFSPRKNVHLRSAPWRGSGRNCGANAPVLRFPLFVSRRSAKVLYS